MKLTLNKNTETNTIIVKCGHSNVCKFYFDFDTPKIEEIVSKRITDYNIFALYQLRGRKCLSCYNNGCIA